MLCIQYNVLTLYKENVFNIMPDVIITVRSFIGADIRSFLQIILHFLNSPFIT